MNPDNTIEAAVARHAALAARLPEAQHAAAAAEAGATTARDALAAIVQRAAAGEAVDPAKAQDTVAAAAVRASFAASVANSLAAQVAEAFTGIALAKAEAHRPVFEAGRDLRLDALRRAEEAHAALAEATADFDRGTGMIGTARANGFRTDLTSDVYPPATFLPTTQRRLPTLVLETAFWAGLTR